eukprot:5476898-Ditylum_brightwellii.AAC.1
MMRDVLSVCLQRRACGLPCSSTSTTCYVLSACLQRGFGVLVTGFWRAFGVLATTCFWPSPLFNDVLHAFDRLVTGFQRAFNGVLKKK